MCGAQTAKYPIQSLLDLESANLEGPTHLITLLAVITGRGEAAIRNSLCKPVKDKLASRLLDACGGDACLTERIIPFANLLRTDAWGYPIAYREKSLMITLGAARRETGTHYTPKSLTESIVAITLEHLVYIGPAEGLPKSDRTLKSSR